MPPEPPDGAAARYNTIALHESGVRVLAGTDAPNPGLVFGASLHLELQHLVEAGLRPTEAPTAATSAAADVFELSDQGRLTVGSRADLLLVDGDPTKDITATQRIRHTWVGGQEPTDYAGEELAGVALAPATPDREEAEEVVRRLGLASLAERWWARVDGSWAEATLVEAQPDRVRVRWSDPTTEQPPSGQWYDLADLDLSLHRPSTERPG